MKLLHNIGISPSKNRKIASNYNEIEEVKECNEQLSFDGVYANIWANRAILKDKTDTILFVMGDYVGRDNSFDKGMPLERYCDWKQLRKLETDYNCIIGWHTWSHPDLTTLTDYAEILREVTPPYPMDYFAYPYGRYNDLVIKAVKEAGFKKAWSVTQGDDKTDYTLKRSYL